MGMKDKARAAYKNTRMLAAGRIAKHRKVAVIYGNCQAEALLQVLKQRPAFTSEYDLISIPAVQALTRRDVSRVKSLISRTDLLLTQTVRDGYRGLPTGSGQMAIALPKGARVLRFPSMFYAGLHPYHVYVHATGELGTIIPKTDGYHDLRHLHAASVGMSDDTAIEWLRTFDGNADYIRGFAQSGVDSLRDREASLDVAISDSLAELRWNSFHTLNHPSNTVLSHAARGVETALGVENGHDYVGPEILGFLRAPIERDVSNALSLEVPDGFLAWRSNGGDYSVDDVARAHLEWYRRHPEVVAIGIEEHRSRLEDIEILSAGTA
jgi:hypothetical protein